MTGTIPTPRGELRFSDCLGESHNRRRERVSELHWPATRFRRSRQVNVRVPRGLAGRGEVGIALTVDGQAANVVKVNIR